ncbi:hypothetical protein B484DRAFT_289606 [Ochromonadaceae sp. CCMP2298]|nr:hypothetical protein B484DRAFT_289606 [Ochromonadaceae sp. CCMP2298]
MNGVAPAVNSLTPNMERLVAALRAGDLMAVISLHASDNSDLYLPFAFCADVPYAVHCAAESKSVALMRWLLEDMHCPTKALQNKNGESVLAVAAREGDVRMMRYLVGQCGVTEIDDIATAHRALHALLEAPGPPPPQARSIRGARLSLPLPTPATLTTAPTAGPPGAAQRASVFDRIADLEVMLASAIFAEQGGGQAETEAEVETDAGEADTPIVSPPNDFTYDSPSTRLDSIALKSGLLVAPPV